MRYSREVLDRKTGDLITVDLGNWIPIRELGEMYGYGRRETTEVLRKLEVLQVERGDRAARHRLAPWFVERGFGKRLKRKADKFPFDVVSPEGQEWIAELWSLAVEDLTRERMTIPVEDARSTLAAFQVGRREMEVQMQVYWLADHRPELTQEQMAVVLSVSQQLVSRNLALRAKQRSRAMALKAAPLRLTKTDRYILLDYFRDGCDHDSERHIHKGTTRRKMTLVDHGVPCSSGPLAPSG
jgi:hypothetical protein